MKKSKYAILCVMMLVGLLTLSGCFAPKLPETTGSLKVLVNLPAEALLQFVDYEIQVSEITVTISKNTTTYTQNIDPAAADHSTVFTDLPAGIWNINVTAKDVEGLDIFAGAVSATVVPAIVTPVTVTLELIPGDLEVEVLFSAGTEVAAGTVTLWDPTDETKQLKSDLTVGATSGTATFSDVRPATWPLQVELLDTMQCLIATGTGHVDVLPGRTTHAQVTVQTSGDLQVNLSWIMPPSRPTGLAGSRTEDGIVLTWNANPENDLYGYLIYRSASATGEKTLLSMHALNVVTYTDYAVSDSDYWYWIQAFNKQGLSSSLSEPVFLKGSNSTIVYLSKNNAQNELTKIVSVRLDGSDYKVLYQGKVYHTMNLSADHTKIHFFGFDTNYHLMTMNVDGTNLVETVIPASGMPWGASWSTDDSKVLLAYQEGNDINIYTLNADGTNLQKWTNYSGIYKTYSPLLSPTGEYGLYSLYNSEIQEYQVHTINLTTGETCPLVTNYSMGMRDAKWSPDGQKIYYADYTDATNTQWGLYSVNPDGTGQTLLWSYSSLNYFTFSPDATQIGIYTGNKICIINLDGTGETLVWNGSAYGLCWAASGTHFVIHDYIDGERGLSRISLDGSEFSRIAYDGEGFLPYYIQSY